MSEPLTVAGQNYKVGKLDTMRQWHVARRLGPAFAVMGLSLVDMLKKDKAKLEDFVSIMPGLVTMMQQMSDADSDFVIYNCLSVVTREVVIAGSTQPTQWAPLTTKTAPFKLMFEDLELPTMLRLVFEVVKENLGGFMKGLGVETPSPSS